MPSYTVWWDLRLSLFIIIGHIIIYHVHITEGEEKRGQIINQFSSEVSMLFSLFGIMFTDICYAMTDVEHDIENVVLCLPLYNQDRF